MIQESALWKSFSALEDPRTDKHSSRHLLQDILLLTILGVICGADSWVAIERFGNSKEEWLKTFLKLPHGIPSHATLGDFFARVNPQQLQTCFLNCPITAIHHVFCCFQQQTSWILKSN